SSDVCSSDLKSKKSHRSTVLSTILNKSLYSNIRDILDRIVRWVLVFFSVVMLFASLAQGASREFSLGIVGAEEVARYSMVATVFLAIPVLTNSRSQISVDAISYFINNDKAYLWFARLILFIEAIFLLIFSNYSYIHTTRLFSSGQSTVALGMPLWVPSVAIPVGAVLGAILTIFMFASTFSPDAIKNPYGI